MAKRKPSGRAAVADPVETVPAGPQTETATGETAVVDSKIFDDAPKGGKLAEIEISAVYMAENVRPQDEYNLPTMVASIERHGFKANHPLVVSKKADGRFLVLCGNRRFSAVQTIGEHNPAAFATLFPKGKIPALVHSGLTAAQEALLRIDHSGDEDRQKLSPWGEFLAVEQLVRTGYDSQEAVAVKLGKYTTDRKSGTTKPARNWAQQRVEAAEVCRYSPKFRPILEAYVRRGEGSFRWGDMRNLAKAMKGEFRNHPNADGPEFVKAWAEMLTPPEAKKESATETLSASKAEELAKSVSSRTVRAALLAATDKDSDKSRLHEADSAAVRAETAEDTLTAIANYLGETEFADLCGKAAEFASKAAESV